MPARAKFYIGMIILIGFGSIIHAAVTWHSNDLARFACYLVVAVLVSGLKVNLPSIKGTMSVNFLFILIGISEMSLSETLVIGCLGTLIQCIWRAKKRVQPIRVLFSIANMAMAITGSY